MNFKEALHVWAKYVDMGRPEGKELEKMLGKEFSLPEAKVTNAMKVFSGEPLWPDLSKNRNFKISSFNDNLKGYLDRGTHDGWMGLFGGVESLSKLQNASTYHALSTVTRAAADELGWKTAEAQAAIWSFTQCLKETGETSPEAVRQYSEDYADIMAHDPEVRAQLKLLGVDLGKLDTKLKAIGEKPEVSSRASASLEDSVRKLTARIEAARGKGSIPAPKSGKLFGEPTDKDEDVEFNPEQITKNASGESEASQEALKRAASEKRQGVKYYVQDSRSGNERPLLGMGAVDYKVQPYEHLIRRGPDGETIMDSGAKAGMLRKKR